MNNYTVACWQDGIYAGVMKPTREDGTKQWKTKTECTDEAIDAVMKHMLNKARGNGQNTYAVQWKGAEDDKTVTLRVEEE